jgi:hypothetical protein
MLCLLNECDGTVARRSISGVLFCSIEKIDQHKVKNMSQDFVE